MKTVRLTFQTGFMAFAAFLGYRHQVLGGGPAGVPPIDAFCPFGALETAPLYLTTGSFLQKTAPSNFWLLGAIVLVTLLFGSVFCGWICPLGTLSDWLYKFRKAIFPNALAISAKVTDILSYGRLLTLAGIVYFSWLLKKLWFEEYDPYKTIFHMNVEGATGWLIIGMFVVASLMVERAWCRFLCPLGAFNGLLSHFSFWNIERDQATCIHCNKCDRLCPTGILVSDKERLTDSRCIKCMQCVDACPTKALSIAPANKSFPVIKPLVAGVVGVVLFLGVVAAAQVTGGWNAKSPSYKVAAQITHPSEIKGWMKWSDAAAAFQVDESVLLSELGLPQTVDRNRTVKDIRKDYGLSEEAFRQTIEKLRKK